MFSFFCFLNMAMLLSLCGLVESDFFLFWQLGIPSRSVVKETGADGVTVSVSLNVENHYDR